MSLIDEALKRARMEAAQKAAEKEGLPYPTIPRHLGPRRRRGWLAPLVMILAVLGGVLVGTLLARRGGPEPDRAADLGGGAAAPSETVTSGPPATGAVDREPAPAGPGAAAPTGPEAAPPEAGEPATTQRGGLAPEAVTATSAPEGREEVARELAAPPAATAPESSQAPADGQPSPAPAEPVTTPATSPPAPTRPASTPVDAPPAPQPSSAPTAVTDPDSGVLLVLPDLADPAQTADGNSPEPTEPDESHVQQVTLADGGTIELSGIAWSETGPFALINGRVVGPGSAIGAYTLEAIRSGHVVLTGDGRCIRLSLQ